MKLFDSKLKCGLATFFIMVLIILEFGILDGYYFSNSADAVKGLSIEIKTIKKSLGYNFCVMSCIIFVLSLAYSAFLGYKKNWGGLIGQLVIAIAPFVGMVTMYNVFFGWGTAHLIPMLTLLGLQYSSKGVLLAIFGVIAVLYVVLWFVGRGARKRYDENNPF